MNLLPFEGLMIPGLSFQNYCIWIFNWTNNPTPYKNMTEVWVLRNDGKKVCYLNPIEAEPVLKKYHSFDEVITADITLTEADNQLGIKVNTREVEVLTLSLAFKNSLKNKLTNYIIKHSNKEKIGEKGKTETGRFYHNLPSRIMPVNIEKAQFNNEPLIVTDKPDFDLNIGDGKPSKEPIINYCTHMLED